MEKAKKIKLFIGLFYVLTVGSFLYFLFSKFSFYEISSYEFIKNNRNYFFNLKQSNLLLLAILFLLFTVVWVFAAGFGSPIGLVAGFIFGKWFGLLLCIFGMTIGATCLYIFANYFLKEMIKNKFLSQFNNLKEKFKKSEFLYLLVYRFVGGIPFALSNVLPCMFNVKVSNFFFATLIGMLPQLFLIISIGSGLEKIIDQNLKAPSFLDLLSFVDIYIPIIAFVCLIVITVFIRSLFYKK
jgi:uncharacterized membrane protein YdjX (TVP38/TMEM64 family)